METLTSDFTDKFQNFEAKIESFTDRSVDWTTVVEPLELLNSRLEYAWSAVTHLNGVKNNDDLRNAYQKVQPSVIKVSTLVSQSKPLYSSFQKLNDNSSALEEGQQRIVTSFLRSSRNGGVGLEGKEKERFNEIKLRSAELSTKFSNNVLDSVKKFSILVTDPDQMKGLPDSLLQLTASVAAADNNRSDVNYKEGPWKLTLDIPCFQPFMQYSENRKLRQQMYKSYITRASSGETDNSDIIEEIRQLRKEKSSLLGFKDYASLSLESKMAGRASEVWKLINELKNKSKNAAIKEIDDLKLFASQNGFSDEIKLWDVSYWAEKQRQHLFSFSDELLRPYFPLPRVLDGLFKFSKQLFGITIQSADGETDVWHEDVRFFKIYNDSGEHLASFYLDPYSRPAEKRGGAWFDECTGKSHLTNRIPVAYLVCNQSPPNKHDGTPSLMTFRDVETLFHEFGHGLQHMLTTVPYSDAAGINNVEWDAVELPSQFMENWMYNRATVDLVSGHYKTGETLPDQIFNQVCKARQFLAGSGMLRQLYFAALDLELHTSSEPWRDVMKRISQEYTVLPPLPEDSFPCSFLHIFGGGYAAGYYSYKWAEVMSADAFGAFQEVGLNNTEEIARLGKRFRDTILAKGGSRHPRDVFSDFRGRPPTPDALLSIYGLS
ncbi:organellar oligopeptidase A, chloroplastic/mitochondrial [Exaiptasia diaphana]|uniref:oligopeptidase A n=1 Tax=Exaiptasia diaphana TaxID=2652724 RepID=A0A913X7L1_EXADI|nr:organellar oligopeptidase A, chloroplastic/mitochondrial [Exaiptasia diaphana]KXJ28508.1 Organellar oligopeptidase A, chloroplastic/mitochondrial [Exaiptasia diaphana]